MKTIIIGAGEVGLNIARHLVMENHDVVVIDKDPVKIAHINDSLDVQTTVGMGAHPDVLRSVGCGNADMLIAVTKSDEINMVACQMAYSLFSVPKKIARVRHSSYLELTTGHLFTSDNMPVDVVVSPEVEVARSVLRTLEVPGAFDTADFSDGRVRLVGINITNASPVIGVPLIDLDDASSLEYIIVAIFRKGRIIIPRGCDHIEAGDELYFVCNIKQVEDVMTLFGFEAKVKTRKVFIIGGGHIGLEICKLFEERDISVRVLESDAERADYLADVLVNTIVLHGDAVDKDLLIQENIGSMDVVLTLTANDSINILASILAEQLGATNIVTRINQSNFAALTDSLKLQKVVYPLEITASRILRHVRRGHIHSLHSVYDGKAQVIEVQVNRDSAVMGQHIRDIELPEGVQIGAILSRSGTVVLPRSNTVINNKDRVILFVAIDKVAEVDSLF